MHFIVLLCQSQQYMGISPVADTQLHRYNGTVPGFQQAAGELWEFPTHLYLKYFLPHHSCPQTIWLLDPRPNSCCEQLQVHWYQQRCNHSVEQQVHLGVKFQRNNCTQSFWHSPEVFLSWVDFPCPVQPWLMLPSGCGTAVPCKWWYQLSTMWSSEPTTSWKWNCKRWSEALELKAWEIWCLTIRELWNVTGRLRPCMASKSHGCGVQGDCSN